MNQEEFEKLLLDTISSDAAAKNAAEDRYATFLANSPALAMQCLVEVAANDKAASTAFKLLNKALAKDSNSFNSCTEDEQEDICERILNLMGEALAEKDRRKQVSACVASVAIKKNRIGNQWPDLWDGVVAALTDSSTDVSLRTAACEIIEACATVMAPTFKKPQLEAFRKGFASCLSGDATVELKLAALGAIHDLAVVLDGKQLDILKPLVGPVLEGLESTLNDGDWEGSAKVCGHIASLAENAPKFFSKQIGDVLEAMMHVASEFEVGDDARFMAVEVMVQYVESEPKAVKKVQGFSKSLVELLFDYMARKEYEDDWETTGHNTEGDTNNFDVGCTCLDRLANATQSKAIQAACSEAIQENLSSDDPDRRVAGLSGIQYSAEGFAQQYYSDMQQIVRGVIAFCDDSNSHVREAALLCLLQLGTDLSPHFQMTFTDEVLTVAKNALNDTIPRIQQIATLLISNFFEEGDDNATDEDVERFLAGLCAPLVEHLVPIHEKSDHTFVKVGCLVALSTIINIGKERMVGCVKVVVPLFQRDMDLESNGSKEIEELKRKALECTTLLASSVGWDAYSEYADKVCEHLNDYLKGNPEPNDPSMSAYLRGWTCMIECMEERALPYLDVAIPAILRVADVDCDMETIEPTIGMDMKDLQDDDEITHTTVSRPGEGDMLIRIRTGDANRKDVATTIMRIVVETLGKKVPTEYLDPIARTFTTNLSFSVLSDIRDAAAMGIGELAGILDASKVPGLVDLSLTPLLANIGREPELAVGTTLLEALSKLVDAAPKSTIDVPHLTNMMTTLKETLVSSTSKRITMRNKTNSDDDEDEDDEEDEEEDEDDLNLLQNACSIAVGSALKHDPDIAGPLFAEHFLSVIQSLVDANGEVQEEQQCGMVLLCEFVENAPEACLEYLETIVSVFLHFASQPESMTSQPAMYGLNVALKALAAHVPQPDESSEEFASKVHDLLLSYLRTDAVRNQEEWHAPTCNAMATALVLIDKFDVCDYNDLFQALVSHLPGRGDEEEAENLHRDLVKMMTDSHPLVVSAEVRKGIISLLTPKTSGGWGRPVTRVMMDDETKEAIEKLRQL